VRASALFFELGVAHEMALGHGLDQPVADEAQREKAAQNVGGDVVDLRTRHAMLELIFAQVVHVTGPKIPAADHAVSRRP